MTEIKPLYEERGVHSFSGKYANAHLWKIITVNLSYICDRIKDLRKQRKN